MNKLDLVIVIPVYNEADAIAAVLSKWKTAVDKLNIRYRIYAYNDGSKDGTGQILRKIAAESEGSIVAIDKKNEGHGPTILRGYKEASDLAEWVFQVDSDDEMPPEGFAKLWAWRNDFDFLVGRRSGRMQAMPRKIVSSVSRLVVRLFYGKNGIWDVNTPYRLMRSASFRSFFFRIPPSTFAPNVILSGLAARSRLRCFELAVPQHDRTTGEVSIKQWKLLKAAVRSFIQTICFSLRSE